MGVGYNFRVVFFVALGSLTYGFNNSIMGTVFGLPSFFSYFDLAEGSTKQTSIEASKYSWVSPSE
jgi:hypothetical protein